jgi:hypothetical protein
MYSFGLELRMKAYPKIGDWARLRIVGGVGDELVIGTSGQPIVRLGAIVTLENVLGPLMLKLAVANEGSQFADCEIALCDGRNRTHRSGSAPVSSGRYQSVPSGKGRPKPTD